MSILLFQNNFNSSFSKHFQFSFFKTLIIQFSLFKTISILTFSKRYRLIPFNTPPRLLDIKNSPSATYSILLTTREKIKIDSPTGARQSSKITFFFFLLRIYYRSFVTAITWRSWWWSWNVLEIYRLRSGSVGHIILLFWKLFRFDVIVWIRKYFLHQSHQIYSLM